MGYAGDQQRFFWSVTLEVQRAEGKATKVTRSGVATPPPELTTADLYNTLIDSTLNFFGFPGHTYLVIDFTLLPNDPNSIAAR
ncbi:hypothetical protein ACFWVU_02370 [Streptomyces sp. NPDC058686]|uniref:hypothetical protein n=1 Tax=Streptomyces sp. NPDC058686 TaxID=3346599 RepID=UPI0036620D1E